MKIAFLSCGSFRHIGAYIDFFKSRGHEVVLIAYDKPTRDYGVPTYDISRGAIAQQRGSKWKYLLACLSLRRLLKQVSPDVVHGHYVTSAGFLGLVSGFEPLVLTAHGSDLIGSMKSGLWKRILRRAFGKAARVNVVSEQLAELARQLCEDQDKVFVSTLGVDTEELAFSPATEISGPVRLLCTRTLAGAYDPKTIVEALGILKAKEFDFEATFAAGGPMLGEMQQLVERRNLSDSVRFAGGYRKDELLKLLHEHDLYISASLWDGTSISLLEAMSAGLFPVVSRIRSNEDWLEHGKGGLMFDCGDSEQLVECILQAADDAKLRSQAVRLNRTRVEQHGDTKANMELLEKVYQEVMAEYKRDTVDEALSNSCL